MMTAIVTKNNNVKIENKIKYFVNMFKTLFVKPESSVLLGLEGAALNPKKLI